MMKKLLYLILLIPTLAIGQVINPTPDMVFKGQLGAGRGVGTDPSAWFSIGPTVGSVRGVVFPQVSDTNSVVNPRRNGLFIWSLQRSRFMYWDSVAVRWKQIPDISNIDTMVIATRAWRQKGDDSLAILINARVPQVRTISINGNTQDLSANRSWTVGTVRKVVAGTGLTGGTITDSGTVAVDTLLISTRLNVVKLGDSLLSVINTRVDTNYISTRAWRQKGIDSVALLVNQRVPNVRTVTINGVQQDLSADRSWIVGTVTNIFTGYGLSGGPISVSGTIQADSGFVTSRPRLQKVADSLALLISNAGGGTVTSVAAGTGMSFPTITNSGSASVDTVMMSTRLWRQKGIDSVNLQLGRKVDTTRTITINGNTQTLSANRTWSVGTVTSVTATGSTGITVSGSPITTSGTINISADTLTLSTRAWRQKGIDSVVALVSNLNYDTTLLSTRAWRKKGDDSLGLIVDSKVPLTRTITINGTAQTLSSDRAWNVGTVTSVGTGYGLSGGPVTSTGTLIADSLFITSRPRLQKVADSLALLISSSGGGTVLSVSAGTGMSFPTITTSGPVNVDTVAISTRLWRQKGVDSLNLLVNQRVRIADTSAMLSPYLRKADTLSLSNRINLKLNISDTAAMLLPYVRHAGYGLTKTPTDAGKNQGLGADTALISTRAWRQKGIDSVAALISASGNGTVTSVTAGTGLTGGTITNSGTIALDTVFASTRAWRQKGDDSLGAIIATKEPLIPAGTTAQYWRGDKSWQTLNTTAVPEGTNLYFTNTRARSAISLTTTGASGASTYDQGTGVLNVPNYTLTGLGGVPSTRVITINGTAQDLSTNRTWNVGTVTGSGDSNYVARFRPGSTVISGGIIYDNGNRVSIGTTSAATKFHIVTPDILGQTISAQSALGASSMQFTNGNNATYIGVNSSAGASLFTGSSAYNSFIGSGSAYGLDLGTNSITRMSILSGGQVRVSDLAGTGTRMVVTDANGQLSSQAVPSSGLAGSGTTNYISKWTPNGATLGDSRLFDNGTNIGIGTNTFSFTTGTGIHLKTSGDANIKVSSATNAGFDIVQDVAANVFAYNRDNAAVILGTQNTERLRITGAGNIQVNSDTSMGAFRFQVAGNAIVRDGFTVRGLAGVGTRMVVSDGVGNLSTQAIPSPGGSGTVTSVSAGTGMAFTTITTSGSVSADTGVLSTRAWRQKAVDSLNVSIATRVPNSRTITINGNTQDLSANRTWSVGTVTSVAAGVGMSFSTITGSGTVNADTNTLGTRLYVIKKIDSLLAIMSDFPSIANDTLVPQGSFRFMRDVYGTPLNDIAYVGRSDVRVVTITAVAYIPASSWNGADWNLISYLPSSYIPLKNMQFSGHHSFYNGADYKRTEGVAFAGGIEYEKSIAFKIVGGALYASGVIQSLLLTSGGVNYAAIPINISYIVKGLP